MPTCTLCHLGKMLRLVSPSQSCNIFLFIDNQFCFVDCHMESRSRNLNASQWPRLIHPPHFLSTSKCHFETFNREAICWRFRRAALDLYGSSARSARVHLSSLSYTTPGEAHFRLPFHAWWNFFEPCKHLETFTTTANDKLSIFGRLCGPWWVTSLDEYAWSRCLWIWH